MGQYENFAYIYDRLMHADINYSQLCDYIENLFTLHGVSPDTLCELACGTGNVTCEMERRGYAITASDISSDMLSVASEKLKKTQLIRSDMSKLKTGGKFDAFICMIDGLNYIITPKALLNTFKRVKKSLNDGGIFVFDISSRHKLENILGNETYIHSDYDVFYSWQNRYIEKYNLSDMLLNFFVRRDDMYERFEERHLQRGWSENELNILLNKAGFSDISVYADMKLVPPMDNSERIFFVCK